MPQFKVFRKLLTVQEAWVEAGSGPIALRYVEGPEPDDVQWKDIHAEVTSYLALDPKDGEVLEAKALDDWIGTTEEVSDG